MISFIELINEIQDYNLKKLKDKMQGKKYIGINRNKYVQFQTAKSSGTKRKNRFKSISKQDQLEISESPVTNSLITTATQNSSNQQAETSKMLQIYEEAKQNIKQVGLYRKKISDQCKLRITAFKESQARKYDENICSLSKKAIEHLLRAEKTLSVIRQLKGSHQSEQKYYRNMQKSLAQQLRQMSKQLRVQEKEHFDRLRAYEKGTANTAIQLSQTQKQKMKSDVELFQQQSSLGMIQELGQSNRSNQITELVKSINKLSHIYKELNDLVIEQGSIIDRIDFNIQQTFTHVEAGNKHLRGAEQKASSPIAVRCMLVLLTMILILAIILGFKYSK